MKILITSPDLDDSKQVGGIITVIKTITSVAAFQFDIFVRSPAAHERNLIGKFKWLSKIGTYIRLCRKGGYNLIHVHTAMNRSALMRDIIWVMLGKVVGCKILLHLHGGVFLFQKSKSVFINGLISQIFQNTNAIIVLSEKEKDSISQLYKVRVPVYVLENAIDTTRRGAAGTCKKDWNVEPLKLMFIGRITESKGVHDMLNALTQFDTINQNFQLDLYGDGDLKNHMVKEFDSLLNGRFKYYGIVSGDAKWKAFQAADVFLLPSRYGEGLPMALLEAMLYGKIVIATDDASIGLVVKDGQNGFIVKKYSPDSIKDTLVKVLNLKNDEFLTITGAASQTVKEKYAADAYIKKLESIYRKL